MPCSIDFRLVDFSSGSMELMDASRFIKSSPLTSSEAELLGWVLTGKPSSDFRRSDSFPIWLCLLRNEALPVPVVINLEAIFFPLIVPSWSKLSSSCGES